MPIINKRLFLCAALLISFSLEYGSSYAALNNSKVSTMSNDSVNKNTASNKLTFCMGRFLIDMPAGSALSGGNYKYDFIAIEPVKAASHEDFEKEVRGREASLKSANNKKTGHSMLLQSVQPEKDAIILSSWKADFSTVQISIEGYRWINGERFLFKDTVDDDKQEFGINRMREALSRLRTRVSAQIPSDPGYCFASGFIANSRWRNEETGVDIDIAGHPDAFVSVWIYPLASHKHDKPLLERMGGLNQALGNLATSVNVLRKGNRQIGPYKGQEHLASAPNSGGMRGHAFVWETQGEGTLDTPSIKIELTTGHQDDKGNPQKTTLTDQQAIKLWDEILNSFRLRPTGDSVKTSELSPGPAPSLPLGELVATGSVCPQTGWWQTSESGTIEGGRRKRFVAGEAMPDVVMLGESSVWQKLKGSRPSYRTATLWKLVGYDEVNAAPTLASTNRPVDPPPAQAGKDDTTHEG
jgi:hypothetical protein